MALKSNPTAAVAAWKAGVGAAGQKYVQGIQNSADWAGAATAPQAVTARNTNWNRAANSGAIERGIQNVGTAGWRTQTTAKAGNWQTGVNSPQASNNAQAGFTRLFGYLQNAENAISAMPRGGFSENMQRFTTFVTSVHNDALAAKGQ